MRDRKAELRETELSLIKKQVLGLRALDALEHSMGRVMVTEGEVREESHHLTLGI